MTEEQKTEQDAKGRNTASLKEQLQTVILPSILLPLGIFGLTYLCARLSLAVEGALFTTWCCFMPLSVLIGPLIFLSIHHTLPYKFKTRRTISFSVCFLILVIIFINALTDSGMDVIDKIQLKNEHQCRIYADNYWEVSRALYYEIRKGDTIIEPMTYYDSDSGNIKYDFQTVYAANDEIVGIIQISSDKENLVAILNTKTKDSWPRLYYHDREDDPEVVAKWTIIFKKLQAENPDIPVPGYFKGE